MRVLVIGGTRFLGRAIVDSALGHGHDVTLFNRGRTNPDLYPGLERIHGDRVEDAGLCRGRRFDVAIDVAGISPAEVRPLVEVLRKSAEHFVFVSTISVYADHSIPQVEGQPVLALREGQSPGEAYGAAKATSEEFVNSAFADRALVVRPGLIVGLHDPTDRFAYWPRRIARGGRVLAPGGPEHACQFIDVRDLGSWVVHGAETRPRWAAAARRGPQCGTGGGAVGDLRFLTVRSRVPFPARFAKEAASALAIAAVSHHDHVHAPGLHRLRPVRWTRAASGWAHP